MTHRKLITQMLEALTLADNIALVGAAYTPRSVDLGLGQIRDAITAAREYLAAPEQSEPVGEVRNSEAYFYNGMYTDKTDLPNGTKLYTNPAPQPKAEPVNQMLLAAFKDAADRMQAFADYNLKMGESRRGIANGYASSAVIARAAIAAAEQAPQPAELTDDAVADALAAWFSKEFEYNSSMETRMRAAVLAAQGAKS